MDFENMSKDELINVLNRFYSKVINPIPNKPNFVVGKYYYTQQTDDDEITVSIDDIPKDADIFQYMVWLSFAEADEYLQK